MTHSLDINAEGIGPKMNHPNAAQLAKEASFAGHLRQGVLRGWAAHAVWILLAILVFAPTIYWLWQRWTMSVWHDIPRGVHPLCRRLFHPKGTALGSSGRCGAIGLGLCFPHFRAGDDRAGQRYSNAVALGIWQFVCLPGFSLLLLDRRRTKALAFVRVLAFFVLPIPAAFIERFDLLMRRMTAVGTAPVIALFGVPVGRIDTTLFIPKGPLLITDACSGFAPLYASVTLALVLAYMNPSWPRRVVMLGAAFPISMACNVLRVVLLALMVQRWGYGIMHTFLHPASGLLSAVAGMALLVFLGKVQMRRAAA